MTGTIWASRDPTGWRATVLALQAAARSHRAIQTAHRVLRVSNGELIVSVREHVESSLPAYAVKHVINEQAERSE